MLSCNNITSSSSSSATTGTATGGSGNGIRMGATGPINTLKSANNSLQAPQEVAQIRLNLANDWKVLRSVHQMLVDEKAFCADPEEWNEKIVDFIQPEELKVSKLCSVLFTSISRKCHIECLKGRENKKCHGALVSVNVRRKFAF